MEADRERMGLLWIVIILYTLLMIFSGFIVGNLFREDIAYRQRLIEQYNVSSRLCLDNQSEIGYCRRLNDQECETWRINYQNIRTCEDLRENCEWDIPASCKIKLAGLDPI